MMSRKKISQSGYGGSGISAISRSIAVCDIGIFSHIFSIRFRKSTGVITFRKILLSVMNRLSAGRLTPSSKVLVQNIVVILPRRNMSSIRILMAAGRYPM